MAAALALAASSPAFAQDMPLSQILIDGEGWKKVAGKPEKPKKADPTELPGNKPGEPPLFSTVRSASGGTIYVSGLDTNYLWAYPANAKGVAGIGARYCPLRTRPGEPGAPCSLTADKGGRIYAATEIGVQVFDPDGRLCGVMTPAAEGKPENLAFEGDTLTLWIGDTKYARKLNTTGAK
ncbi:hypothetical protein FTUN_3458 [Frigoriglobus tundricola]|uniref:Uncharacterized protein n=2 Tax=Frigoriglobus tundricola TaxID=2774151 RepID=A0A6M5YR17_9BACT|nr:hypothetical protein FTUN_3458 [Frigoriglobus tundricola]